MRRGKAHSGFTLLELSIVLIIIGLVTGMSLFFGMGAVESARRTQTENKLREIEQSLQAYREQYDRLPCPTDATLTDSSANYGVEASKAGTCTGGAIAANYSTADGSVVEGAVPFATLNLPPTFMYDGWGRKFAYAVNAYATAPFAFQTISVGDSCGITVDDASENPRSPIGAIYALVSFGKDGHGGYTSDGTRYNAGATNADELTNCHCTSTGSNNAYTASYVARAAIEVSATNEFYDIVRFRQRWQMMDYEDQYTALYTGPQLMVGFQLPAGNSNSAYGYRLQCGKLKKQADLNPVATESATGVAYLSSNSAILVFSKLGCELYTITNNGTVNAGSGLAIPGCPAYSTSTRVAMSSNGFLAITETGSPYVLLWQETAPNSFTSIAVPSPPPPSQPDSVSISPNFLVVSSKIGNYLTVYSPVKTAFTAISPQPTGVPPNPVSSAISPNEMYVGATTNSPLDLYLWHITGLTFTAISPIAINGTIDNPAGLTFSPDGRYIALGGTSGDNVGIFKIDANDTISQLAAPTNWTSASSTAGTGFAFTQDSNILAMLTPSTTKPVVLFKWMSATQYQYLGVADSAPAYPAISGAFCY